MEKIKINDIKELYKISSKALEEKASAYNSKVEKITDNLPPCNKCGNKRLIMVIKEGKEYMTHCSCLAEYARIARLSVSENAIIEALKEKSLANFETAQNWQVFLKAGATAFCVQNEKNRKPFFAVFAQNGAGKTHICASIMNYSESNKYQYFYWPELTQKLKNLMINDFSLYCKQMEELKTAEAVFFDNFLETKSTETDKQIAAELIFFRSACKKLTLIASATNAAAFAAKNPAIFGQIRLAADKFFYAVKERPERNFYSKNIDFI